ncbi:MAG TPA: carboxypeptidase-like regulatory domain-containing protein, partial [Gemmatimonadales bacterium]|nr:carboxypeptidase-like regulatory domain-containing protein [Gemmatimonadales bacterium]
MRRLGILLFCLFPLLTGRPDQAAAQVGVTTDILTGTVTDTSGTPLSGATVEAVSLETGLTRGASTDGRGRYRILFPDGGGRYQLFVKQIGHAPARRQVERVGDDDRLVADFRLIPQAVALEELVVSGRRQNFNDPRPTPGSTETVQTPDRLARLPLDAGDLNAIAALAAGVVSLSGTDSTAASFSVAGQRSSANSTTLDGLSFGASSVPQDAVRSTRVITNTYDVSRGQFSGGLIASTTRSGTRIFQGTVNGSLRDPALAVIPDSVTNQPQAQQQLSFGVGGPLITNRLFAFGAGQVRHRGNDLITLLTLADGGAERYGVAQDSLDRYTSILGGLNVPFSTGAVPSDRSGTDWSGI